MCKDIFYRCNLGANFWNFEPRHSAHATHFDWEAKNKKKAAVVLNTYLHLACCIKQFDAFGYLSKGIKNNNRVVSFGSIDLNSKLSWDFISDVFLPAFTHGTAYRQSQGEGVLSQESIFCSSVFFSCFSKSRSFLHLQIYSSGLDASSKPPHLIFHLFLTAYPDQDRFINTH